ncbi:FG-GAP repeat protein [Grimontia marina]|nr:FG-GAP repeat protein [Grimontia marina]
MMYLFKKAIWMVPVLSLGLTACGEEDTNTTGASVKRYANISSTTPPGPLNLAQPSVGKLKNGHYPVTFSWDSSANATGYTLCRKDETRPNSCESLGNTSGASLTLNLGGPLKKHLADFFVLATNSGGSTASNEKALTPQDLASLISYVKASNTGAGDYFGYAVSMSGDGKTLAVGANGEDSNSTINKNDNKAPNAGAVYVYRFAKGRWKMSAYIKASNIDASDYFGYSVSMSEDGNTLAVGAPNEDSDSARDPGNNSAPDAGAVYVYRFDNGIWGAPVYIKASNIGGSDYFGASVSLSGDGNTLAVGAHGEASNSAGDPDNNSLIRAGAAYVYRFDNEHKQWGAPTYIKASNVGQHDEFGWSVSLSGDSNTLAVGAHWEDSDSIGTNGADNNEAPYSGAVYVYRFADNQWKQDAYIKASNTEKDDYFGTSVSVSGDGNTLAVGAYKEASNSPSDQSNNKASSAGAVYVYRFANGSWKEPAYIKASNIGANNYFGRSVSLSGDGNTLAVGAHWEDSDATGIDGADNNKASASGAVYLYRFANSQWEQDIYIKASNTAKDDYFGFSVSVSGDGNTLAVGATGEDSNVRGINNAQYNDTGAENSGAVYVF